MRSFLLFATLTACAEPPALEARSDAEPRTDTALATLDSAGWWEHVDHPADIDGDGSVGPDDCDDLDPTVLPGALDLCDGIDDDCDGQVDEDAPQPSGPDHTLEASDEHLAVAYPFPTGRTETFTFYAEDPWFGVFGIDAWVNHVPDSVDLRLELWRHVGAHVARVELSDDGGSGRIESIHHGGTPGESDAGTYEVRVITMSGAACDDPYTLQIRVGGT